MRIVRTILALLLAVAVATAPAAAGAITAVAPPAAAATADAAAMPDDCAHHHAPADHGSKGSRDTACFAACVAHCFTYAGTTLPGIAMMPKVANLRPLARAGRIASNLAAPPFRPPRI